MHVVAPEGHDRVSDYASTAERFRYIETADGTCVVNLDHVVEIAPSGDDEAGDDEAGDDEQSGERD